MPAYPDVPTKTNRIAAVNELKVEIGESGAIFAQDLSGESVYLIELTHPLLLEAQVQTLRTNFATNKLVVVTTPELSDGYTYDCVMLHEPELVENNGIFNTVKQKLYGTRN